MEELNSSDDESLVRQTQAGDTRAFDALWQRYSPRIYSLIYNMTSNHEDTNDLLLEVFAKAYRSMSGFRGGPTFPGMFIGAVGGIALSHLPGLPMVAGAAMGIGAMTCAMLNLPLTSVLLATLFLASDGLQVMPLVIVAVVVTYVARAYLPSGPRLRRSAPVTSPATGPEPSAPAMAQQ